MSRVDKEAFADWIPLCWAVDCKWRYRKQRGIQRIFCWLNIDTTLTLTTQKLYTSFHNTLTLKPWGFANSVPGTTLILEERISPVCIIAAFLSRQKLPRCQKGWRTSASTFFMCISTDLIKVYTWWWLASILIRVASVSFFDALIPHLIFKYLLYLLGN